VNCLASKRGCALTTSATDQTIVASTIGLGHGLGLNVVTEGVEDAQTWELLRRMGCDVALRDGNGACRARRHAPLRSGVRRRNVSAFSA